MPQTLEVAPLDNSSISTLSVFNYLVVLFNRKTEQEESFGIETQTDSFCEVLNVIHSERVERGLLGFEILEVLDRTPPF